jgi:phosphoribosylformylglycinamidine synthase
VTLMGCPDLCSRAWVWDQYDSTIGGQTAKRPDAASAVGLALKPGLELVVVGRTDGWLGQSLWLREIAGREAGPPPPVDLAAERKNGDFVRAQILAGHVAACHDASDGGLLVAVAEMALAGGVGVHLIRLPKGIDENGWWFGEDQSRYVLAVADAASLMLAADDADVPVLRLGSVSGERITLADGSFVPLSSLREAHERFFPAWMGGV